MGLGGNTMYYDGWMPDGDFEMAYDGYADGYNPYFYGSYDGFYNPWHGRRMRRRRFYPRYNRYRRGW